MKPSENERICLISYQIAKIRVGGNPGSRTGFWPAYRHELELNRRTSFQNYHVHVCQEQLMSLQGKLSEPAYFRGDRLVTEQGVLDLDGPSGN